MSTSNRFRLASRLFLLLAVLCCLAVAVQRPPASQAVFDSALNAITACANTFDGRLDDCISGDPNRCVPWTGNPNCGNDFGSCFGDDVNLYGDCLNDITFEMDTCTNAHIAAQRCEATFDYCTEAATTMEELGGCMWTNYTCRNESGIDNCQ